MNYNEIFKSKEIISGYVREVWIYGDPALQNEFDDFDMQNEIDDFMTRKRIVHRRDRGEMTQEEVLESESRRLSYLKNSRHTISRIINSNSNENTKFLTLTFEDDIRDYKIANNKLDVFWKRLRRYLNGKLLKYLWTWELTKKGRVHFHVVLFDFPFIKKKVLEKIWGNGFIHIKRIIPNSEHHLGRYISKYFLKATSGRFEYKQKLYAKSQNLTLPVEKKTYISLEEKTRLEKQLDLISSYKNEYYHVDPDGLVRPVKYFLVNIERGNPYV